MAFAGEHSADPGTTGKVVLARRHLTGVPVIDLLPGPVHHVVAVDVVV